MKTRVLITTWLLLLAAIGSYAQKSASDVPKEVLGTWSGGWEGMGQSGGFELTLEKGKDGGAGRVAVTGERRTTRRSRRCRSRGRR